MTMKNNISLNDDQLDQDDVNRRLCCSCVAVSGECVEQIIQVTLNYL